MLRFPMGHLLSLHKAIFSPRPHATKVSPPGIEPDPRPSQSRVQDPPHPEDILLFSTPPGSRTPSCRFEVCRAVRHTRRAKYPDLDSNQGLDLRRVRCYPLHHRDIVSIPTWSRTRTWTLGGSRALRYTIGTWSRRLDLHQHHPVYKTGASLFGHVGTSTGVRNRTPLGGFGGRLRPRRTPV